jgi:hypothetical protein
VPGPFRKRHDGGLNGKRDEKNEREAGGGVERGGHGCLVPWVRTITNCTPLEALQRGRKSE